MLISSSHKLSVSDPLPEKSHKNSSLKLLVIGHRGVGKTRLLTRLAPFLKKQGVVVCHLDEEVERQTQKSIKELFENKGERFFRDCEVHSLSILIEKYRNKDLVIDVGAGFLGEKPKNFKTLWLQRAVDLSEAVFLDRPKLGKSLKISQKHFEQRQKRYSFMADYQLELPEDLFGDDTSLKKIFEKSFLKKTGYFFESPWFLTKLHENHKTTILPERQKEFLIQDNEAFGNNLLSFGKVNIQTERISPKWELRNDLLSFETIKKLVKENPKSLISFRQKQESKKLASLLNENSLWDWPLEWGFNREAKILSLHKRQDCFNETLNRLPCSDQFIKLAVPIRDFNELKSGYRWFQEEPGRRIFLPISKDGRWKWFRLLTASGMPFGFLREALSPNPDQPTLMDLLNHRCKWSFFAAILGSPVNHSLTPSFHRRFFAKKQMNCLSIDLLKDQWEQALPFLEEMGLRAAAVTSPLKKKAARWLGQKSLVINTLCKSKRGWLATGTDKKGLKN